MDAPPASAACPARSRGAPDWAALVRQTTTVQRPPLVPELQLWLGGPVIALWQQVEAVLAVPAEPPYWAYAWAGGQALARYLLDRPETVAGRTVLDFGAGGGIAAIAAARAGAAAVTAADIDPLAAAALQLNATLNGVAVQQTLVDLIGHDVEHDIVLIGDVCYERSVSLRLLPWLRGLVAAGRPVLMGDPGRAYCPPSGHAELAAYEVPTDPDLEGTPLRRPRVLRLLAAAG